MSINARAESVSPTMVACISPRAIEHKMQPAADFSAILMTGLEQLHQLFADVLALHHPDERARRMLDSVGDRLEILDFALANPLREFLHRLITAGCEIRHDEALQLYSIDEQHHKVVQPMRPDLIVLRDEA